MTLDERLESAPDVADDRDLTEVNMIASGVWKPSALPWVARDVTRQRVYEAAKVVSEVYCHSYPDEEHDNKWEVVYRHRTPTSSHREGFFGWTLAEALERLGEALEQKTQEK